MISRYRFTISGRVVGAVGGGSCSAKNGGPSNVNVKLLYPNDDLIYSIVTSPDGSYLFKNVIPGMRIYFSFCFQGLC